MYEGWGLGRVPRRRKTLTWRRPCQPDVVDPPGLPHLPPRRGTLCHKIRGKGEKSDASPKIRQGAWYADPFSETSKFVKSLPSLWSLVSTWICNKIFSKCIGRQNPMKACLWKAPVSSFNEKHSSRIFAFMLCTTKSGITHWPEWKTKRKYLVCLTQLINLLYLLTSQDLWLESKPAFVCLNIRPTSNNRSRELLLFQNDAKMHKCPQKSTAFFSLQK